jgi:branched-chain amino acid transport system ATP-binding protein
MTPDAAVMPGEAQPPALELAQIDAGYGQFRALRGVQLTVPARSVVALLGANGAGKTTTMRVATGLLRPSRGQVRMDGADITRMPAPRRARQGLCLIPEGRGIFRSLTVRENLELQVPAWRTDTGIEPALEAFPVLKERLNQVAESMSGGQQQMLALSRAHIARPRVVLLDEVSLGLAPVIVDEIFESLAALVAGGAALIIVEQYVSRALALADRVCLLARGEVVWQGPVAELTDETLAAGYLGHAVG